MSMDDYEELACGACALRFAIHSHAIGAMGRNRSAFCPSCKHVASISRFQVDAQDANRREGRRASLYRRLEAMSRRLGAQKAATTRLSRALKKLKAEQR